MPVCSYLVQPRPRAQTLLMQRLQALPGCRAYAAEQHALIVLVTDTADANEERRLHEQLAAVDEIAAMALTFAHDADDDEGSRLRVES